MKIPSDFSRRQFITTGLTAAGAAVLVANTPPAQAQLVSVASSSANNDWKKAAKSTFENLKTVFQQSRTYWQLGQTFDTIIDYFIVTNSIEEANAFSKVALDRYAVSRGSWYDDYAWWAIANLKAAQHKELFGDDCETFYKNSLECWARMAPSTTVWDHAQTNPKLLPFKPAVAGGAWNHGYDTADTGAYNPLNPNSDVLGGFQNTVTNALRLVLSARLTRYDTGQSTSLYRDAMESEYQFLQAWFTMSRPGFEPLLNVFEKDKAVVRERISCYDSGLKLRGYRSNLAWAGDQGLIIGGLAERMEIVKPEDPTYPAMLSVVRQILAGVLDFLAVDSQLLPWWPDPSPGTSSQKPAGDPADYRTGIAVFMRYLLAVYSLNNADLKAALAPYRDFAVVNARRVLQYPSAMDRNVDASMIALTNDLAVLTAVITLV